MPQVFGSRKCPNCHQKYDWTGLLNNQIDKEIQKKLVENRDFQYAQFSKGSNTTFKVNVRCPHCNYPIEFDYDDKRMIL